MRADPAVVDDDETMSAIRAMMTEPVEAVAPVPKIDPEPRSRVTLAPSSNDAIKASDNTADSAPKPRRPKVAVNWRALRSNKTLMIWGVLALLFVLRPHVFVLGLLTIVFVIGASFAIFGSDKVWGAAMRGFERYARVAPLRAERFARRMDGFALRWDAVLDRFPDGLVDGLYLPDFQSMSEADERHAAAMDERLARMQAGA